MGHTDIATTYPIIDLHKHIFQRVRFFYFCLIRWRTYFCFSQLIVAIKWQDRIRLHSREDNIFHRVESHYDYRKHKFRQPWNDTHTSYKIF